jgi:hypothetical protein
MGSEERDRQEFVSCAALWPRVLGQEGPCGHSGVSEPSQPSGFREPVERAVSKGWAFSFKQRRTVICDFTRSRWKLWDPHVQGGLQSRATSEEATAQSR